MKVLFLLVLFLSFFAKAHPVIYKDGFVYWGEFHNRKNTQILSYTFHPHFAFQLSADFYPKDPKETFLKTNASYQLGLNILVKRWFLEDSQANIYTSFQGGFYRKVGFLESTDLKGDDAQIAFIENNWPIFRWNLSADWESRKIYTAGKIAFMGRVKNFTGLEGDFNYRIGFAPYVAGMDALQTWFVVMFQASGFGTTTKKYQKNSFYDVTFETSHYALGFNWGITPLLRFFYKNVLWEIGSNLQNDFYLTLMVHY